jgi:hypothetical protein
VTVQFIAKKSKCAGLAQEIGFFGTIFLQIAVAGKGRNTTQLCTSKK